MPVFGLRRKHNFVLAETCVLISTSSCLVTKTSLLLSLSSLSLASSLASLPFSSSSPGCPLIRRHVSEELKKSSSLAEKEQAQVVFQNQSGYSFIIIPWLLTHISSVNGTQPSSKCQLFSQSSRCLPHMSSAFLIYKSMVTASSQPGFFMAQGGPMSYLINMAFLLLISDPTITENATGPVCSILQQLN